MLLIWRVQLGHGFTRNKQQPKKNKKNKSNKENKTPKQINNKSTNKIKRLYFIFTYFVDITCNVLTLLSLSLFLFLFFFPS